MDYCVGLSNTKADNYTRQLVYWCNNEECKHFVVTQKIESGDPNIPATMRVTMIKPVGRAKDTAKYYVKVLKRKA